MRFDLFEFYRYLLTLLVSIHCAVRLVSHVYRWQAFDRRHRWAPRLRRYAVVHLLRLRFRRFWVDATQIAILSAILLLLISRHWR